MPEDCLGCGCVKSLTMDDRVVSTAGRLIGTALTLGFASVISFTLATALRLTASNPYEISNAENEANRWGPETNFAQAVLLVALLPVVFLLLQYLRRKRPIVFRIVIVGISSVVAIHKFVLPAAVGGGFDPFHYGEQLAPSLAFLKGKDLFTEIYVLHGAGEDVFKTVLGFGLFSDGDSSVGAYILATAVLKSIAVVAFFALLAYVLRSTPVFLVATIWFAATGYNGIAYIKFIPLYLVIAAFWFLLSSQRSTKLTASLLIAIGFVSSVTILYSIDIGALLGLVAALGAICLVFVRRTDQGIRLVRPSLRAVLPGVLLTVGVIAGQLVTLIVLRDSYLEYLKVTFLEIPRYQAMLWDYPIPGMTDAQFGFWLPILVAGVTLLLVVLRVGTLWKTERWSFDAATIMSITLLLIAVVNLRYGTGRPDLGHILMAAPPVFLAAFFALSATVRDIGRRSVDELCISAVVVISLFLPATQLNPVTLFVEGEQFVNELRVAKNLPTRTDGSWLNEQQSETVEYLKEHTKPGDSLWVMDPEPSYYYFTGLENPTRFYISIFADPAQYTDEVLNVLKDDPPTYVLYSVDSVYATLDGSDIRDRLADVDDWIKDNYTKRVVVAGSVILTRG